ncbi:PBECR2 nuclease fold domain-containing protein [Aerococcus mictus]|uniref:PBECR3 domain-containing polyvalent protein n=1 Tax=Aerococcus mictus TaxID=2976810 RepID=UPI0018A71F87|nr:PBECR2 nuclease fold domain-containing protein [Aerococcus mictus]
MKKILKLSKALLSQLGINVATRNVYMSKGLITHLKKRNHHNVLKYVDYVSSFIEDPDYIGNNPKVPNSFECIKILDENILVAVKLDKKGDYFYIASMYEITDAKLHRNIKSGRLKKIDNRKF